ncbi:hypothetical protein SDC9_97875 [bioreactor metagenome]|uniref:Uncharacterized protein n=1 Tax=bioreactor metagenome TaxID=1076179 RepID=A0A645AEJ0_9ZZZZ
MKIDEDFSERRFRAQQHCLDRFVVFTMSICGLLSLAESLMIFSCLEEEIDGLVDISADDFAVAVLVIRKNQAAYALVQIF